MKKFIAVYLLLVPFLLPAQQNIEVKITLRANEGGYHTNIPVSLVDTATKDTYRGTTDINGEVVIPVPPNAVYDVIIPNYTARKIIQVPDWQNGGSMSSTLFYSRKMVEEEKAFAMSDAEKAEVDRFANALPDTTYFTKPDTKVWSGTYYARVELILNDLDGKPLGGEVVTVTGRKRHKSFKGTTDAGGHLVMHLPKGDLYDLGFYYHKNFELIELKYSRGSDQMEWEFAYIGTKEYKRRQDEEAKRLAQVAKDQAAAQKAWEEQLRRSQMSIIDQNKESIKDYETGKLVFDDDAVIAVLKRNPQWKNKLIVCDVTGSMSPYMIQLMIWFKQARQLDPGVQFVFYNDANPSGKMGGTNNWLYTNTPSLDTLISAMVRWNLSGGGGSCSENDIESLIMATKLARKPFDEIVLIADNDSPPVDMPFMSQLVALNKPVHVILCDSNRGHIEPEYLALARNTKGSVHTSAEDYFNMVKLQDGQTFSIGGNSFQLMKGEFIKK